jgi:hypothetical protein
MLNQRDQCFKQCGIHNALPRNQNFYFNRSQPFRYLPRIAALNRVRGGNRLCSLSIEHATTAAPQLGLLMSRPDFGGGLFSG